MRYVLLILLITSCGLDGGEEFDKQSPFDVSKPLFFGVGYGMDRDAFIDSCTVYNLKGEIRQGWKGISVYHKIDSMKYQVDLNFFPDYENQLINQFTLYFGFPQWSPWNKELDQNFQLQQSRLLIGEIFHVELIRSEESKNNFYYQDDAILITLQPEGKFETKCVAKLK
ncbi:hypothetical protein [Marinigracilibium pacificum]|uniref:Uncharacterized protein n=1 Tax=Marinigracilibium pacificum TaxID=2729599 RepID=A0A848IWP2_9BACT|nr:hypothetical protein [Marinigracilibium pacificum]NMM48086.1 hypothetical protein [Marinigracilibium pacificum]